MPKNYAALLLLLTKYISNGLINVTFNVHSVMSKPSCHPRQRTQRTASAYFLCNWSKRRNGWNTKIEAVSILALRALRCWRRSALARLGATDSKKFVSGTQCRVAELTKDSRSLPGRMSGLAAPPGPPPPWPWSWLSGATNSMAAETSLPATASRRSVDTARRGDWTRSWW